MKELYLGLAVTAFILIVLSVSFEVSTMDYFHQQTTT